MADYIELGKAKRFFENIDAGRIGCPTLLTPTEFAEYLDEIELADVVSVSHAKYNSEHCCSNCGEMALKSPIPNTYYHTLHCWACNARMDLEE